MSVKTALSALSIALITSAPAMAQFTWPESPDAGNTPATAQSPVGSGSLNSITGSLSFGGDADVYRIAITDPANFSASAIASLGTQAPPIFLFNAAGLGIAQARGFSSGEGGSGPVPSIINSIFLPPTPGTYFLVVATQQTTARNAANALIWSATPAAGSQTAPNGPGSGTTLASFNTPFVAGGAYTITLTARLRCRPRAAALLGLGVLAATRRRR